MPVADSAMNQSHARRSAWPAGWFGMLALICGGEVALSRWDAQLTPLAASNWRQSGIAATSEATRAELLFFGDSLVKTGLIPVVFQERTRLTSYNLALLGAPTSASYFLLRRALDSGARPRAVVLNARSTSMMMNEPCCNYREWSELIGTSEIIEIARSEGAFSVFTNLMLYRALPSIRYRNDVRTYVASLFSSHDSTSRVPWLAIHDRQQAINLGSYIHASVPKRAAGCASPLDAMSEAEKDVEYPEMWWCRPANLVYLEKFFRLAESRGIPVFFLIPPIHPDAQAERDARGLEPAYDALMSRIEKRFKSVVVVDARHSGFEGSLFWDFCHLGRDGAVALSAAVADLIAARLENPDRTRRWVRLSSDAKPSARLAIEDVEQSRSQLQASETIRR